MYNRHDFICLTTAGWWSLPVAMFCLDALIWHQKVKWKGCFAKIEFCLPSSQQIRTYVLTKGSSACLVTWKPQWNRKTKQRRHAWFTANLLTPSSTQQPHVIVCPRWSFVRLFQKEDFLIMLCESASLTGVGERQEIMSLKFWMAQ